MIIFDIIVVIGLSLLGIATIYLYFLAVVAFVFKEKTKTIPDIYDFLVLIPAHNEGKGLIPTLSSLRDAVKIGAARIVVIADNCDDDTVRVAQEHGVEVIERHDRALKGKGYALQWAINQYTLNDFDAVAIVDADTVVEPGIFQAMAASLVGGAGAVQLNYINAAKENNALSYLQYLANLSENYLFYLPRKILNLPILLRGTGMAIRSDVLQRHPWNSGSITEDADFAIDLIRDGYKIDFTTSSSVYAVSAESFSQSYTQKSRWVAGTFALIRDKFGTLVAEGFRAGRMELVELAFSLLLLNRPTLIYLGIVLIILSLLSTAPGVLISIGTGLIILLIIYILSSVAFAPVRNQFFAAILLMPIYGVWYLVIQLKALLGFRKTVWERTGRNADGK